VERLGQAKAEAISRLRDAGGSTSGWNPDLNRELAHLEREARKEMGALMTPEQFEEFELRNSKTAERLRRGMPDGFDITPEEFRRIFRGTLPVMLARDELRWEDADDKRLEELDAQEEAALPNCRSYRIPTTATP
jgi:hypothetical protein